MKIDKFYIDFLTTGSIVDYLIHRRIEHSKTPEKGDKNGPETKCGSSKDKEYRK